MFELVQKDTRIFLGDHKRLWEKLWEKFLPLFSHNLFFNIDKILSVTNNIYMGNIMYYN